MLSENQANNFKLQREQMVEFQLRRRGIKDQRVLEAMSRVPRHEFVPEQFQDLAYEDHPVQIGEGQTISQPYIVALMLESLRLLAEDIVLEVGTGSGYQTALLAELAKEVHSIERHRTLAATAKEVLARLGCTNAHITIGDGSQGIPGSAPYDAVVVSAAAPQIPPALFEQLKEEGRMIVPVGPPQDQELQLVRKISGEPETTILEGCRFVPLIGTHGYPP